MKKVGRNDPCHCGSGKKFKKCCESKMIRGRFLAIPITQSNLVGNLSNLGDLFQAHVHRGKPLSVGEEAPSESNLLEDKGDFLLPS